MPEKNNERFKITNKLGLGVASIAVILSSCGSLPEESEEMSPGVTPVGFIEPQAHEIASTSTTIEEKNDTNSVIEPVAGADQTEAIEPVIELDKPVPNSGPSSNEQKIDGPVGAYQKAKPVNERNSEKVELPEKPIHKVTILGNSIAAGSGMDGYGFFDLLKNSTHAKPGLENIEFSNRAIPGQTNGQVDNPIVTNPDFATMQQQVRTEHQHLDSNGLTGEAFIINPSLIDAMLSSNMSDEEIVNNQMLVLEDIKSFLESKGAFVLMTPYVQISQEQWYSDTSADPQRIISLVEKLNNAMSEKYRIPVSDYALNNDESAGGDPQFYDEHLYFPPEFPNGIPDGIHLDYDGNLQIKNKLEPYLTNVLLSSFEK